MPATCRWWTAITSSCACTSAAQARRWPAEPARVPQWWRGSSRGKLDSPVRVTTHGGDLRIAWGGGRQPVLMTGPAQTVFEGEIESDHRASMPRAEEIAKYLQEHPEFFEEYAELLSSITSLIRTAATPSRSRSARFCRCARRAGRWKGSCASWSSSARRTTSSATGFTA